MTGAPNGGLPGFVAEEPEHGHDWCQLIRPGQPYYLTIEHELVCPDCIRAAGAIRLSGGLTVGVGGNRLVVRRGSAKVAWQR